jgi:hypothetical protein
MARLRSPVRSLLALLAAVWIVAALVQAATADDNADRTSAKTASAIPDEPSAEMTEKAKKLLKAVDQLQLCYFERHKTFSDNPAELTKSARDHSEEVIDVNNPLVLAAPHFELDFFVSEDGQAYSLRITGDDFHSTFERDQDNEFVDYGDLGWKNVSHECRS